MNALERCVLWFEERPLLRFVATVLALLPASFLLWFALGSFLAAPAVLVAKPVLLIWLPELIQTVEIDGTQLMVMTSLGELGGEVMAAETAGNQLGYPVNTRVLSYSIPFFAALHFATPRQGARLDRFAWSLLALWLLLAVGIVATTLKNLMLGLGHTFLEAPFAPPADSVALAYQFSTIMVPPLAPVLLWAFAASDSPALRSLLPPAPRPAQRSD